MKKSELDNLAKQLQAQQDVIDKCREQLEEHNKVREVLQRKSRDAEAKYGNIWAKICRLATNERGVNGGQY